MAAFHYIPLAWFCPVCLAPFAVFAMLLFLLAFPHNLHVLRLVVCWYGSTGVFTFLNKFLAVAFLLFLAIWIHMTQDNAEHSVCFFIGCGAEERSIQDLSTFHRANAWQFSVKSQRGHLQSLQ